MCTRDGGCGFRNVDFGVVKQHEQQCPKASSELAEQPTVLSGVMPTSRSVSHTAPGQSARLPSHAARINWVLQVRQVARLLRSSMRDVFVVWCGLCKTLPVCSRHHSDDEMSVVSASYLQKGPQHASVARDRRVRPPASGALAPRPPTRSSMMPSASTRTSPTSTQRLHALSVVTGCLATGIAVHK